MTNRTIKHPFWADETKTKIVCQFHYDSGEVLEASVMDTEDGNPDWAEIIETFGMEELDAAKEEAKAALNTYWSALEGTIDPSKVERATDNAVIGNVEEVAKQIIQRFDRNDKLMCWFDFFNHDSERVQRNMKAFMDKVAPIVNREE